MQPVLPMADELENTIFLTKAEENVQKVDVKENAKVYSIPAEWRHQQANSYYHCL